MLQLGQSVEIDFTLKLAKTTEEVTVQGETPLVDTHDASVSEVVGQQQIEGLPINGRDFISFAVITPGVTVDNTPQQGASATSGLSFAGQRARSNNIMVDGLDNNDASLGAVRAVFSQEAIREFQVLTNSYSAEFGKASGGVVNIVTKSGTNELHGNVFGYFRDKSLNSKSHFEKFDIFGDPVNREKSLFVQDEWRVSDKLTIKPGVRYQMQFFPDLQYDVSNLNGTRYQYGFAKDFNNVAPRISLSFDPKGNGKTALHASYGIFYDNILTGVVFITDAIDGSSSGVRTLLSNAVPIAGLAGQGWNPPNHRLTEDQALALLGGSYPSLGISLDPGLETPYAHQAAVGFEQAIGKDFAISVHGLYARGKEQLGTIEYNPRIPALGGPTWRPNDMGGRAGTSAAVLQYTTFGETWYKGITATLEKRYRKGSQFLISYTLSKSEDNSTDFQSAFIPQSNGLGRNPADPTGLPLGFDPNLERGPAVWDQRHRLVVSGL